MAERNANRKVPEFLKEPLEAVQQRLAELEEEAQRLFKDLMQKGKESRKDVAELVQRLSKQDWGMRDRVVTLREQGMERANELRGKVEKFRAEAMGKLEDVQTKAAEFLGVATREQVEALSKELEKLARRLDKADRVRRQQARKPASRRTAAEG